MLYDPNEQRVLDRCKLEFAEEVSRLQNSLAAGCRTTIPWAPYETTVTKNNIPRLVLELRKVYEAKAAFALTGPTWGQPLPLGEECYGLLKAKGAMHMIGLFAFSLQLADYDYQTHPQFDDFACGVMAHEDAPADVKEDLELQAEFPARELPGLSGRMLWSPPAPVGSDFVELPRFLGH